MKVEVPCMFQAIILDISGLYAQIHDQFYCTGEKLEKITDKYSDEEHWKIIVLNM